MRGTGGRAHPQLWRASAITLLFLIPLLPVHEAQSTTDPWWGPTDRTKPTEGFAVRIPITVENKLDYTLVDPFVAAEIDFGKLLVEGGWTNQTVGAETRLRGFTLDLDSIRVVPYNRGFSTGPIEGVHQKPIPHVFYPALLEAAKFREFDAARNPAGTVLFQVEGDLPPQAKRSYYVYANPVEFGKSQPYPYLAVDKSPLDSFMWGTSGTVAYGYEPHQQGQSHLLRIVPMTTGAVTHVTVSTYELGRYVPIPSTTRFANPMVIQPGQSQMFLVPAGRAFKVEASRPIQVIGMGEPSDSGAGESTGWWPGRSGSFADDSFFVYGHRNDFPNLNNGAGATGLRLAKASGGAVGVTSELGSTTLTNANPTGLVNIPFNRWSLVTASGGKVTVSTQLRGQPAGQDPNPFLTVQVPATTGGPSGNDFFTFIHNENGFVRVCPETDAQVRLVDYGDGGGQVQLFPDGTLPSVPPAVLPARTMCHEIAVPRSARANGIYEFYSIKPENAPAGELPANFRVMVGAGHRHAVPTENVTRPMIGHYGGLAGVDYHFVGDTGLFGHYNNTRLTIFEERERDGVLTVVNRTRALQRDEYFVLTKSLADSTGRFRVVATKPFAAASLAPAFYKQFDDQSQEVERNIPYARHVPGRPLLPAIEIGAAQFRGPLIELRSPETEARQLFRSTGPGSPISFRLDAANLGRWIGNEDLADVVSVTCTTPAGWTVDGCNREVALRGGTSERLNVVVTPSIDDVNATRTILVEARSKNGGVAATFKLIVYVEIRYGVGMWFDVEGGRKTIDPPIGLNPAETYRYNVLLKNTGSTLDTFDLSVEDAREGWDHALLLNEEPISRVRLEGGESVMLTFRVKAPNAETAPQNIVSIMAQSQSSALAADVVNTATRIRPKVDLELTLDPATRLAAPNETVTFNVTTRNKGNDVFTVIFAQDSLLPKGWRATLSVPEITLNPNPGNDASLNYVLRVAVTPPEGARAGDLASVKLSAEIDTGGAGGRVPGDEVSAVVVVRRVFNLTTPPTADAETPPGNSFGFVLPVTNAGNGQVAVEVLPGAVEARLIRDGDETVVPGWRVRLDADDVTLGTDETADLPLTIDVPPGAAPGTYNLTFTTRLSREAVHNLTVPVQVQTLSRVGFEGPSRVGVTPGRPIVLGYVAANTGNTEGSFAFGATTPEGWNASVSPARARLAPGERVPVTITLNATRDATDGPYALSFEATAEGAPATSTPVTIDIARPQLHLTEVTATGALRAGEVVLVTAGLGNRGGIEATNVSLVLTVDGRVVDRALVARVPVGTTSLVSFDWVATQRGGDVRVVIDPDHELSLATREDTDRVVTFGSRLSVPGAGVVALLALAALVALARRREERP